MYNIKNTCETENAEKSEELRIYAARNIFRVLAEYAEALHMECREKTLCEAQISASAAPHGIA